MKKETLLKEIEALEWEMFTSVHNEGGRADCQDDHQTFRIMRNAQEQTFPEDVLESYLRDLNEAKTSGQNMLAQKYGYMMEYTYPEEYETMKASLPEVSKEKKKLIQEILTIHMKWKMKFDETYPLLALLGRPAEHYEGVASTDIYLEGELKTWSLETLKLYQEHVENCYGNGENQVEAIMFNTVKAYGFDDLSKAEESFSRLEIK